MAISPMAARIPAGKIMTYGQIAQVLGGVYSPKLVGFAMNAAPHEAGLPCHRVVNAAGRLAPGWERRAEEHQALVRRRRVQGADALLRLVAAGAQLRPMSEAIMDAGFQASQEVYAEIGAGNVAEQLVINKIDLAPMVGASLEVMAHDAKVQRGTRPFVFTNLKTGQGLDAVIAFIRERGMLG